MIYIFRSFLISQESFRTSYITHLNFSFDYCQKKEKWTIVFHIRDHMEIFVQLILI